MLGKDTFQILGISGTCTPELGIFEIMSQRRKGSFILIGGPQGSELKIPLIQLHQSQEPGPKQTC